MFTYLYTVYCPVKVDMAYFNDASGNEMNGYLSPSLCNDSPVTASQTWLRFIDQTLSIAAPTDTDDMTNFLL